jgi:hypothetical protein
MDNQGCLRFITDKSIREGLRDIRFRRRWLWLVFLGYLPVMATLSLLGEWMFPWAAYVWMGLFMGAVMYVWASRCPRCGERFHFRWAFSNPWARKCLHCGLNLRADLKSASAS